MQDGTFVEERERRGEKGEVDPLQGGTFARERERGEVDPLQGGTFVEKRERGDVGLL